jgi:DNA-binding NarL/FixJ family response regulator
MKQVLIVDDSEQIRQRLATQLAESTQIRVAGQADNGRDAISAVQRLRPDAVILDIQMPGSSGIQVLKTIKALHPDVMVIILTNFDDAQYRRHCRQLGADHFLNKTLELGKIADAILNNTAQ